MKDDSPKQIIMIRHPRAGVIRAARSAAGITLRRWRATRKAGYSSPASLVGYAALVMPRINSRMALIRR